MAFKKGTTIRDESKPKIDCAYAPQCTNSAVLRRQMKTGWANLCVECDERVHQAEMRDRWVEAGKPGAAESIARMKAIMRRPKPTPREHCERILAMKNPPREAKEMALKLLRRTEVNREPGCDDEEVHELAR